MSESLLHSNQLPILKFHTKVGPGGNCYTKIGAMIVLQQIRYNCTLRCSRSEDITTDYQQQQNDN